MDRTADESAAPWTLKQVQGDDRNAEQPLAYEVIGTPNDLDSALKLAADEPHQFQYWITQAIDGQPNQAGREDVSKGKQGRLL